MFHIGIVAHTARAAQARSLARQVRADFISTDNGILGCDLNHRAVQHHLSALPGEWSVVLEDDAVVPATGFGDQLAAALAVAPTPIVSLYLGRVRPPQFQIRVAAAIRDADNHRAHWLTSSRMLHAVGYAIRTALLPDLLDFDSELPVDQHIGAWAGSLAPTKPMIAYCWPSLCDHADVPTIVEHPDGQLREPGRVAWRCGTRERWTGRSVALTA